MQIVIDIDENVFTRLFDNGIEDYEIVNDDLFAIAKAIRKGTPLPENATNGDVIKTLFSKCMWNATGQDEEWWNAPYEGSDKE